MQCCKRIITIRTYSLFKGIKYENKLNSSYINRRLPNISMATSLFNQVKFPISPQYRILSQSANSEEAPVDAVTYEVVCDETLESLTEYFEELLENSHLTSADVSYSSGVLTVDFGLPYGVYVINRQSPNRQIWLSSPLSGPKRYDYVISVKTWIYKHTGESLHHLLQEEIKNVLGPKVNFSKCSYSVLK